MKRIMLIVAGVATIVVGSHALAANPSRDSSWSRYLHGRQRRGVYYRGRRPLLCGWRRLLHGAGPLSGDVLRKLPQLPEVRRR